MREVRRLPGELRAVEGTLDYNLLPDNAQERVKHLLNSIESVAARLRVVKTLLERVTAHTSSTHLATNPLGVEIPHRLQQLFERWAMTTRSTVVTKEQRDDISMLYQELEERLETYHAEAESHTYSEQMATDFTALLGGMHGLLDVMAETDRIIDDIDWAHLVEARF